VRSSVKIGKKNRENVYEFSLNCSLGRGHHIFPIFHTNFTQLLSLSFIPISLNCSTFTQLLHRTRASRGAERGEEERGSSSVEEGSDGGASKDGASGDDTDDDAGDGGDGKLMFEVCVPKEPYKRALLRSKET
jgi:hypothetical protein